MRAATIACIGVLDGESNHGRGAHAAAAAAWLGLALAACGARSELRVDPTPTLAPGGDVVAIDATVTDAPPSVDARPDATARDAPDVADAPPAVARPVQIALGAAHACARFDDGTVWCWGANGTFAASGNEVLVLRPHRVPGVTSATSIAAGAFWTCAALRDGTARCWGYNQFGQLGDGTDTSRREPVPVQGLTRVAGLSAGVDHTCAWRDDGTVWCWGRDDLAQLGAGDVSSRLCVGPGMGPPGSGTPCRPAPVMARGVSQATQVEADGMATCARLADGGVWCWGESFWRDTRMPLRDPQPIEAVHGAVEIAGILLFRRGDGSVARLSGSNPYRVDELPALSGAMGIGRRYVRDASGALSFIAVVSPEVVARTPAPAGSQQVAAVDGFRCALLDGGTVVCWGNNGGGQLGDGTTIDRDTPAPVRF